MLLLLSLFWMCQFHGGSTKGSQSVTLTNQELGYGPSYKPRWLQMEVGNGANKKRFSYDGPEGPDHWGQEFSGCSGRSQSPINIATKDLLKKKTKKSLKWVNYSKAPKTMVLENSGHSIHASGVWKSSSEIPYITNGPLEQRYFFSQLHFHWDSASIDKGSEHTVNNKSFIVEMHVVHDRIVEKPTNLSQENNSNHLVVVGYMFELDKNDNPALTPILEASRTVAGSRKKKTEMKPFSFENLVQPFQGDYVTYKGSLTTPPCTEGVIWILNSKPLGISKRQLGILRNSVKDRSNRPIKNYRPVQQLNGRKVYYIYC